MSIVVVEGCDGSGKTTLIERAREGHRERYFLVVRAARYPPNIKTSLHYLNWIKQQKELDLILDRIHFISDRIYGPLLRNEDLFKDFPMHFGLQDVSVIVYARPPIEVIRENVNKNHQMKGVKEQIDSLVNNYDIMMEVLKREGKKIIHYDYTQEDAISLWRHVWSEAKGK